MATARRIFDPGLFLIGIAELEIPKNISGPGSYGRFSFFLCHVSPHNAPAPVNSLLFDSHPQILRVIHIVGAFEAVKSLSSPEFGEILYSTHLRDAVPKQQLTYHMLGRNKPQPDIS